MKITPHSFDPAASVSVLSLREYSEETAISALTALLAPLGGLSTFVRPGMRVVIKANLVAAMKPETGATTHPVLLAALARMITALGATVVIGDSPGGLYNAAFVGRVYSATGLRAITGEGVSLNEDFSEHRASYPDGKVLRDFTYTGYLDDADVIINFCKVKSHGMMGLSCAAKNMFGVVPGIIKPEYHYRFPRYEDFADMILDLDEYFHPVLSIADGVVGMEGNGPTAGTPKPLGFLLASTSPHCLDLLAARLLGFAPEELPLLQAAARRGLLPSDQEGLSVYGETEGLYATDFERVVERRSLEFKGNGKNPVKRFFGGVAARLLRTRPVLKRELCVGCGVCAGICPAKAITIVKGRAKIARKKCIRCFCCQEFCPKSALKVHRTPIAEIFHREKK